MCAIVEVGSAPADLARLRRQRAELEKKLGYETYRAEEAALSPRGNSCEESLEERHAFKLSARRRIRAALKRKLKPSEKIKVPKLFRGEQQNLSPFVVSPVVRGLSSREPWFEPMTVSRHLSSAESL